LCLWLLHLSAEESPIAIKLAFTYGTRINLFLHIINGIFVFISEYKNKQLEAEELKRIITQAQLQSIKNQVNPHFLFNNLNVLSGMVMKDNPDANKFIEEFAKVYRYILNSQDKELISLQTELDYIKPYIFLLEKRFPESISIELNIPNKYYSYYIVPAALQMLIENAIKHNVVSKARPLQISLSANGRELLTVKNNLQIKQLPETSSQIGLKNISQRYEFITGKNIEIIKDDLSFSVAIPLIQAGI
jgi:two-component system, LytTR family, sensor kinase